MLQELRKREGFSLQVSDVLVARALPEVARARLKSQDLDGGTVSRGPARPSVEARRLGVAGVASQLTTLTPENIPPERLRLVERVAQVRIDDEPAMRRDLTLELPSTPTGVPHEEPRSREPAFEGRGALRGIDQPESWPHA